MMDIFPDIQYITQNCVELTHAQQAALMYKKGIKWVQIRMKNTSNIDYLEQAREALYYAKTFGCKLIINDSVEIAKAIGAHGVHLGLNDTSVCEARDTLGPNFLIGGTANTYDDICLHVSNGADYVGVGPYRFTKTKKNLSPILGLNGFEDIYRLLKKNNITIPIYAIGGITLEDKNLLKNRGIHRVAMSTALLNEIIENYNLLKK